MTNQGNALMLNDALVHAPLSNRAVIERLDCKVFDPFNYQWQ